MQVPVAPGRRCWHGRGMPPPSSPGDHVTTAHLRDLVRAAYEEKIGRGHDEVDALHLVAIEQGLSLRDCARAVDRTHLVEADDGGWQMEWNESGRVSFAHGRSHDA